jgi:hypothetical protein
MKLICLDKKTFFLLALVLRQFGLSVFRSGSDTKGISQFFKNNNKLYDLLTESLNNLIRKNNIELEYNFKIEKKSPMGIIPNLLIKRKCFYLSDFSLIINVYFSGFKILKSGKFKLNEEWATIGHQLMALTNQLIEPKLSKKEKKIINRIEHFCQNDLVYDKYFSLQEALDLLNK